MKVMSLAQVSGSNAMTHLRALWSTPCGYGWGRNNSSTVSPACRKRRLKGAPGFLNLERGLATTGPIAESWHCFHLLVPGSSLSSILSGLPWSTLVLFDPDGIRFAKPRESFIFPPFVALVVLWPISSFFEVSDPFHFFLSD